MSHAQIASQLRSQLSPNWNTVGPYQWGTISAIGAHGTGTVDLYLDGSASLTTGIPYIALYSPQVGDVVLVARMAGAAQAARVALFPLNQTGGWQPITLDSPYTEATGTAECRLVGTRVELAGILNSQTAANGSTVCTLPEGYWPSQDVQFGGGALNGSTPELVSVSISTAGVMRAYFSTQVLFGLGTITFPID